MEQSYKIQKLQVLGNGTITYDYTAQTSNKKTKKKQTERTLKIMSEKDSKKNRKVKIKLSAEEIKYLSECDITNIKSKICKVLEGI